MATTVNSVQLVYVDDPLSYIERGAIAGFLAGYTGNTLVGYTTDLRLFAEWCTNNDVRLLDVRRAHLEIFGRTMEANGRMRSTVARRLSTLGGLLPLLPRRRHPGTQPRSERSTTQSRRRIPHPRPRPKRARRSARSSRSGHGPRSRPHRAAGVEGVTDQRSARSRHRVHGHGPWTSHPRLVRKGGKHVIIPLAPRTGQTLDLYIGEPTTGPIFLSANGQRMDRYAADRTVKRLANQSGITTRISPHSLRHSLSTAALDAGVPLRDVQETASHADPRTTMRYDHARQSLD